MKIPKWISSIIVSIRKDMEKPEDPFVSIPQNDIRVITGDLDWRVIEVEGCEYFYQRQVSPGYVPVLCHKGNCKNPLHKRK